MSKKNSTVQWFYTEGSSKCIWISKRFVYLCLFNHLLNLYDMLQKQISLLLVFFFFSFSVFGQNIAPVIEWQRCFGGTRTELIDASAATKDGGFIFVGRFSSTNGDVASLVNHGGEDIWVVKCSFTGEIQWQKFFGGNNIDLVHTAITSKDGGYLFLGHTRYERYDL